MHPPYGQDVALSEYHLLFSMTNNLASEKFNLIEALKTDFLSVLADSVRKA